MRLPKMKIRPVSQQSCAAWGGIDHNPTAGIGTWWDSRNLTSDKSPTMCARSKRSAHASIDGNTPQVPIVAMCGGTHPVLLDETGTFWCNGHSQQVTMQADYDCLAWWCRLDKSQMTLGDPTVQVTPWNGRTRDWTALNHLGMSEGDPGEWSITQDTVKFKCIEDTGPVQTWKNDFGNPGVFETPGSPEDYNLTVTFDNFIVGLIVEVRVFSSPGALDAGHRLVRMGSRVVDPKARVWIDAEQLAAGGVMIENVHFGSLNVDNYDEYSTIELTMCDIDGNPYTGVVVSATEPAQQGLWLDTSGQKPALREWSVSTSMWIVLASTYVRIKCGANTVFNGVVNGDTVKLSCRVPDTTDQNVEYLLNSYQYIQGEIEENLVRERIVAGILPSATVTVTAPAPDDDGAARFTVQRLVPEMDYVVEADNRLWGCRYSQEDHINEIYASKLGDPANWDVFQGLSIDSWMASRGREGPYTGAAVLDGHPLFFREESVEKVYPSSSGAHQIQTFDLEGVEDGAADSLVVIEDRLYYKSRGGVMVYTGSVPRRISDAFGDMVFRGGSGGRHKNKYCLSTTLKGEEDENVVLVLDLKTGDWHIEDEAWTGQAVTWKDDLYYIDAGSIWSMAEGAVYGRVNWYAETAPQAIHYSEHSAAKSLTEHKWISYLRLRFRMLANGTRQQDKLRVYIAYEDGAWQLLREFSGSGTNLQTWEMNLLPRRKDNFRLRFEGNGPVQIFDAAWRMERSEGGH